MVSFDIPASNGISPYALYRKLQKVAEENADSTKPDPLRDAANELLRNAKNQSVRVRNAQIRLDNAAVESDVNYFRNRLATATTTAELLNDDRVLKVIAFANGLGDLYTFQKQRLKDVLNSDLTDANSVARQGSTKELELAKKFNFGRPGASLTDTNGTTLTVDANGNVRNDGTGSTLDPGLANVKSLVLNTAGNATLKPDNSLAITTATVVIGNVPTQIGQLAFATTDAYGKARIRSLLKEETAPAKPTGPYEFDGPEFQRFRERADLKAEVDYYRANITDIKSLDDFFADRRLVRFVLTAYDLESEAVNAGKVRKIIESDLTDINSLANRFQDPRFKKLTEDIGFSIFKEVKLKQTSFTDQVVKQYEQVRYEKSLDETAPGVRAALEFKRRAKDVNQTIQLLGDAVLREVITVANNIPQQLAVQEVSSQVTALERRGVDVSKFKDSGEVDKIVLRYLTNKEAPATSTASALLNLLG